MELALTSFERAIQLAKSGNCECVDAIKTALLSEGYATDKLDGLAVGRHLRVLIAHAHPHIRERIA